jgi:hypothetical protein
MTYDEQALFQVEHVADRIWYIFDMSEDEPRVAAILDDSGSDDPRSDARMEFEAQAMAVGLYEAYEAAFLSTRLAARL